MANQAANAGQETEHCVRPVRVLHVLGRLQRGGVETLLMHALRNADRERYRMDFLVHSREPGDFDEDVLAMGSRIWVCPIAGHPVRYSAALADVLRRQGPYDVVHSHVHYFSGWVLRVAHGCGVPVRIAHSHTVGIPGRPTPGFPRRAYAMLARRMIARHATAGLAASEGAAADLFGLRWRSDRRWNVFRFGIDLRPFTMLPDRARMREELGVPVDDLVIGHVGRFSIEKNHAFLLEVVRELASRQPHTTLLLVGDGDLRPSISGAAKSLGLADHVVFAGSRGDVPRLLAAMDVFVLPSFVEGLPVAVVEALAAGLPCVVSEAVAEECFSGHRVVRLSLGQSAHEWAETIRGVQDQNQARADLAGGPFDIRTTIKELEVLYDAARRTGS